MTLEIEMCFPHEIIRMTQRRDENLCFLVQYFARLISLSGCVTRGLRANYEIDVLHDENEQQFVLQFHVLHFGWLGQLGHQLTS